MDSNFKKLRMLLYDLKVGMLTLFVDNILEIHNVMIKKRMLFFYVRELIPFLSKNPLTVKNSHVYYFKANLYK